MDWKKQHANDSERAMEHELVRGVMDEFTENVKNCGYSPNLFAYGLNKVCLYVAQVARAQALGFDPDTLRMNPEESADFMEKMAEAAVRAGKPVIVVNKNSSDSA